MSFHARDPRSRRVAALRLRVPTRWGRGAAAACVAAAAVLTLGSGLAFASSGQQPHLPTVVNAPGTWSSDEGVDGPVAALGIAERTRPVGLFDHTESLSLFAVSALDGRASWLRLPGFALHRWGFVGGFTVSPDGRWIGWVRPQPHGRVAGWSVMDTTTGKVRRLADPDFPWVRGTVADLAFSGDSRYLLTSYEPPGAPQTRGHQFVAWDVETGTPTVLEKPGLYWLPNLGSAPTGVVWARGHQVFRADPDTGDRRSVTLPQHVVTASWGPDGKGFAYIGRPSVSSPAPWRLYVGDTPAQAQQHPVALPRDVEPGELLGWRDATHVVVGHFRSGVQVVDIETDSVETIDLAGAGKQLNSPYLAGALWQRSLATPAPVEGTTDPRGPWRWGSAAAAAAVAGALLVLRTRRPGAIRSAAPAGAPTA